jgi:hypothetical protein
MTFDIHNPLAPLREEFDAHQALFECQPAMVQRFLEAQGRQLAEAMLQNPSQVRFALPDRVVLECGAAASSVPGEFREQVTGSVFDRLTRADVRASLRQRLAELEGSARKPVAAAAALLRFATAYAMIYSLLPSGRSVHYAALEGEEIPSVPTGKAAGVESAITQASDAIVEEGSADRGRGELQVPFVPDARRFFLPQWVAFGQQGSLLVNTIGEAESHVASMQRFLGILHAAVSLAPYFVADGEYQSKRYGMLGQLVNQGRALAHCQTEEIIRVIKQRVATHDLNRGLSLSLPYFDDQALLMRAHDFVVIPAGRIMFVPAFVVRAALEEQAKVAQDTRLSPSTRKYLMAELKALEAAFLPA